MRPIILGVAGGSGSGKTTVVREIVAALGLDQVAVVHHDSYYRDASRLPLEERAAINYDHPDSLETELLVEHLRRLRRGEVVDVPIYDFSAHNRRDEAAACGAAEGRDRRWAAHPVGSRAAHAHGYQGLR